MSLSICDENASRGLDVGLGVSDEIDKKCDEFWCGAILCFLTRDECIRAELIFQMKSEAILDFVRHQNNEVPCRANKALTCLFKIC